MATQDIVIGRNFSIQLIDGFGVQIALNRLKKFTPRYKVKNLESQDFTGINRHRPVYTGVEGTLEFEQIDDTIDTYFSTQQAAYLSGAPQQYSTIIETVTYSNGATAQYLYDFVVIIPGDMGARSPDEYVMPTFEFYSSQRHKLK